MTPIVELDGVVAAYGSEVVLRDVTLSFDEGAFVGVVGPSGAGKTSLLRILTGQLRPLTGSVRMGGSEVQGRAPAGVAYVPQVETIDWSFPVTVREVVAMGFPRRGLMPWIGVRERAEADELCERLGIAHLAGRHIRDLSGGQQQRAFLARALVRSPRVLLLDEPTTGVDIKTRHDVLHVLHDLNHQGIAIVLTTHDLNAVAAHLPSLVCLNHRVIAAGAPEDVLTPDLLERTYGERMSVIRESGRVIVVDEPGTTIDGAGVGHGPGVRTGAPRRQAP